MIAPRYGHERPPDCIFATSSRLAASLDVRGVGGLLADSIGWSMVMALLLCFAAVLLREVFRGIWLAAGTLVVIIGGVGGFSPEGWYALSYGLLGFLVVVALTRLGLLSVVGLLVVRSVLMSVPTTLDLSAWYADVSIVRSRRLEPRPSTRASSRSAGRRHVVASPEREGGGRRRGRA